MATLKSPAAQTSAGCRVLIVEDDPEWRDIHADNLAAWGYGCIVANGTGQALLQDAIHKAYLRAGFEGTIYRTGQAGYRPAETRAS